MKLKIITNTIIKTLKEYLTSDFIFAIVYIAWMSNIVTLPITVLIGHFTGNIGLYLMEKTDAINSIIFLMITHYILSVIVFILSMIYIFKKERK